jgi:hypothetical protein
MKPENGELNKNRDKIKEMKIALYLEKKIRRKRYI